MADRHAITHPRKTQGRAGPTSPPALRLGQNDDVTPSTANAKALSDTLMREIASTGGVKRYPANAVLINEGDAADTLFIILSGRVKVYAGNAAGKEVILN